MADICPECGKDNPKPSNRVCGKCRSAFLKKQRDENGITNEPEPASAYRRASEQVGRSVLPVGMELGNASGYTDRADWGDGKRDRYED